jgi:hypothetical protein
MANASLVRGLAGKSLAGEQSKRCPLRARALRDKAEHDYERRELHHFFALRMCNRAQWEIRAMAKEMYRLCLSVAPLLFEKAGPGCIRGACPEGEKTCGKMAQVRREHEEVVAAARRQG